MKRQQPIPVTIVGGLLFICLPLVLAAIVVAGVIYGVEVGLGLQTSPAWIGRVIAAPVLYVTWLLLVLGIGAIELRVWALVLGYRKLPRLSERENRVQFYSILMCYQRQRIVWQ